MVSFISSWMIKIKFKSWMDSSTSVVHQRYVCLTSLFSLIHETHLPFTDIFFKNPSEKCVTIMFQSKTHDLFALIWQIAFHTLIQGKLKIVGKHFKLVGFLEKYNCIVAFQCLCKFNFRLVWPAGLSAFCALYNGLAFFKFSILTRKTNNLFVTSKNETTNSPI